MSVRKARTLVKMPKMFIIYALENHCTGTLNYDMGIAFGYKRLHENQGLRRKLNFCKFWALSFELKSLKL